MKNVSNKQKKKYQEEAKQTIRYCDPSKPETCGLKDDYRFYA